MGTLREIKTGKIYLALWMIMGSWFSPYAQRPFDCNGRMFRALERDEGTVFEEITIPEDKNSDVLFSEQAFFPDIQINGICYRATDNLIYGLELGAQYRLVRIDANFQLEILATLPLPAKMSFVAGDISPDGRYLVLLGFSHGESQNLLARVDLSTPDYATQLLPLRTLGREEAIQCADIAFHPTTGVLYGFDHLSDRLVTIDIQSRSIDNRRFPKTEKLRGNMPSLFFGPRGRLFGIASPNDLTNRRLFYELYPATGGVTRLSDLATEGNQDGCSCPYEVALYNRISQRRIFPCTEVEFTFILVNRSPLPQRNLKIRDTLGGGLVIKQILHNPFPESRMISGVGTDVLAINGIEMPIGEDSIRVLVEIPQGADYRRYRNQAFLYNVNSFKVTGPEMRVSDDPETPEPDDPTAYEIRDLQVDFSESEPLICPGESIILQPQVDGALGYQWSTGEEASQIRVADEGLYRVTVTTICAEAVGEIYVRKDDFAIDLGEDLEAEEGEYLRLSPAIRSQSPVLTYFWSASEPGAELSCLTCPEVEIKPMAEQVYGVEVMNENGCLARDQIRIQIHDFTFYAPTAFSPDGDGVNDRFHLFGKTDFSILDFKVFNRWGGLLYHCTEAYANDPQQGWDGQYQNQFMDPGIYVWSARIKSGNGTIQQLAGEVYLIR